MQLRLLLGAAIVPILLLGDAQAQRGGRDPARMLQRFDKNKDGKLTEDEVDNQRMWRRLAAADKDEDGAISKDELASMSTGRRGGRRGRGREASGEAAWKFLAEKYDADKDGKLTKEEYARDEATFKRLDKDGDGVLSSADWKVASPRGRRRGGGRARSAAPTKGDAAPDFELTLVADGKKKVKLSSFAGEKPVALIFGSCT